eukprot:201576-Pyramimonas_sp.AAC.1
MVAEAQTRYESIKDAGPAIYGSSSGSVALRHIVPSGGMYGRKLPCPRRRVVSVTTMGSRGP